MTQLLTICDNINVILVYVLEYFHKHFPILSVVQIEIICELFDKYRV